MSQDNEAVLRVIVVGGVAGGASAAARARRCDARAQITILEKGPVVSFANCGLPYHIGGEIEERSKLLVATPELFWERFRIRVRVQHEVKCIDRQARTVTGVDDKGQEFKMPYDRLILATGAEPFWPPTCVTSATNVFQLWTLTDMDRILAYLKQRPAKRATVIGAGFIGLEVVEQLQRRDIAVTLVERCDQVLPQVDREIAKLLQKQLEKNNVNVQLSASVEAVLTNNQLATAVKLASGSSIASELVIVAAGVRPRTQLAKEAGLTIGNSGAVAVNEYGQTEDPLVYAVGDMAEVQHGVLNRRAHVPLAGPANRAGRTAGSHAVFSSAMANGSVNATAIVRVFDLAAGVTGLTEKACIAEGIEYRVATIQATHHANYFPGARGLTIKLIYSPSSGKVLGAQAVGGQGVDKRIDVISTLLHFGGQVEDLANLDLAYAPPFGSAKDPLHMAAFAAQNDLAGIPSLLPSDADLSGYQVVDVRKSDELKTLPLPGAMHIPVDELADRWNELDPLKPTVTVCHSGKRAHVAACWLRGNGFKSVANLNGGMSIRRLFDNCSLPGTE
ncbi:MAG: FAD-dependent oxidoreductase [Planctomycetales bacterium]|nr:FAD-dependent oxidoreductase [Planctomycetales bacterium]